MQPFLSIIIPTLNSGNILTSALESIVTQNFNDIEVLIIDGLSSDNTLEIAEKFKLRFSYIKIFSEPDKGIYDAMNKGIQMSSGSWVYFLGADDTLYHRNTLKDFRNIDNLQEFDVIYGNVSSPRFDGIYAGEFSYSKLTRQNLCHQSIFFNRRVFDEIGLFNLSYTAHADWDHNIRWFFSSKITHKFVDIIIANYADGGFSSVHGDKIFQRDKELKFLWYGGGKIPYSELITAYKKAYTQGSWGRRLILSVLIIRIKLLRQFRLF